MTTETNNTLTISNAFTGFEAKTRSRNVATIRNILRKSKADGCTSETLITDGDGNRYDLVDTGNGAELRIVG